MKPPIRLEYVVVSVLFLGRSEASFQSIFSKIFEVSFLRECHKSQFGSCEDEVIVGIHVQHIQYLIVGKIQSTAMRTDLLSYRRVVKS